MKQLIAFTLLTLYLSTTHAQGSVCGPLAAQAREKFETKEPHRLPERVDLTIDITRKQVASRNMTFDEGSWVIWSFALGYCFGAKDTVDRIYESPMNVPPTQRKAPTRSM